MVVLVASELLAVVLASVVLGSVIPSGLCPLSTQYCNCMLLSVLASVAISMFANVQSLEAHRPTLDMRRSRFPFLHQHPELSQPWKNGQRNVYGDFAVGTHARCNRQRYHIRGSTVP